VLSILAILWPAIPAAASQEAAPQTAALSADYRIGPRDLLEIRVFGVSEFDSNVRVSEGGTIPLPLVGDLVAAGLTRAGLETAIESALSRYVTDAQVSVFIREFRSQRFSVIGAVRNPGTYEMVGFKSLIEAISDAGGINAQESAGSVTILRTGFTQAPIEIDLQQLLEQGNAAYNIELQPGDTVNVVPKRRYFIYVYGQVRSPGAYELREEVTLLQAISFAQGVADRAARDRIRILRRKPDGTQEVIQVNLVDIVDGKKPDVPILPNDVIVVPETWF
jgi:polysaccharide export outer membrane protein